MRLAKQEKAWAVKIIDPVRDERPFFCGIYFWAWRLATPLPPYMTGMTTAVFKTREEARKHVRMLMANSSKSRFTVTRIIVEIRETP